MCVFVHTKICKKCGHGIGYHEDSSDSNNSKCNHGIFNGSFCRCTHFDPIDCSNRLEIFQLMNEIQFKFESVFSSLLKTRFNPQYEKTDDFYHSRELCLMYQELMSNLTWLLLFGRYDDFEDITE